MAQKKLHKSKTNFTLKRLHQSGNFGNIYERDYTTITGTWASPEGQIPVYGSPTFKMSVRAGFNGKKKYNYGSWLTHENGNRWTLDNIGFSSQEIEKITLKPNTHRLTDFACYGSSMELVRATLEDIVSRFPAELYVTDKKISSDDDSWENKPGEYVVDNPMMIDLLQQVRPEGSVVSPLRYFCDSYTKYDINGVPVETWSVTEGNSNIKCLTNGTLMATIKINNTQFKAYYYEGQIIYFCNEKVHVRPNEKTVNEFYSSLDDFEKVLLNRHTNFTATFETYVEDEEEGWQMMEQTYQWPKTYGGWNLATNGQAYSTYVSNLADMAEAYDVLFTDGIWKSMTHEAIANLDLTLTRNGEDVEIPNSSKVKKALSIIGRQFDEIKKYADNIKVSNSVSYQQDSNVPDYFLSDKLELQGWEPYEVFADYDRTVKTDKIYGNDIVGYGAADANAEFSRRLVLNSRQIFAKKGTKQAIEELMAVFGYHSVDWLNSLRRSGYELDNCYLRRAFVMEESVYMASDFLDKAAEIKQYNALKNSFPSENINDDEYDLNPYYGLPVAEAEIDGKTVLVPWFDKTQKYDGNSYFQMKGGWPEKTISKTHVVNKKEELYEIPYMMLDEMGFYYVISLDKYFKISNRDEHSNTKGWSEVAKDKVETIIDNNKGNNPHIGDYDEGESYLNIYKYLFGNSTFPNLREEIKNEILSLNETGGFETVQIADTQKCFALKRSDVKVTKSTVSGLRLTTNSVQTEKDALKIINSKAFHIIFDISHKQHIEKEILPYIKQIIPSTSIFTYSFENLGWDDNVRDYDVKVYAVACESGICPIFGVIE